jgi:hypothetical protein
VITLDDLEYSYPDDGDQCYYCGRKWIAIHLGSSSISTTTCCARIALPSTDERAQEKRSRNDQRRLAQGLSDISGMIHARGLVHAH